MKPAVLVALLRFPRQRDARNSLQVICQCYVVPTLQESAHTFGDRAADFDHKIAAGFEFFVGGGDELRDDFETGCPGEDGAARFELADFELNRIFFGSTDVRRVRDHELECLSRKPVEQIGVVKVDAAFGGVGVRSAEFELETGGVGFGDFKCCGRDVGGVNFGVGKFLGQRESDRSGAGADVSDDRSFHRASQRDDGLDEVLGLRSWDQDGRRDDEIESPEFLVSGDVLRGDALGALG